MKRQKQIFAKSQVCRTLGLDVYRETNTHININLYSIDLYDEKYILDGLLQRNFNIYRIIFKHNNKR